MTSCALQSRVLIIFDRESIYPKSSIQGNTAQKRHTRSYPCAKIAHEVEVNSCNDKRIEKKYCNIQAIHWSWKMRQCVELGEANVSGCPYAHDVILQHNSSLVVHRMHTKSFWEMHIRFVLRRFKRHSGRIHIQRYSGVWIARFDRQLLELAHGTISGRSYVFHIRPGASD